MTVDSAREFKFYDTISDISVINKLKSNGSSRVLCRTPLMTGLSLLSLVYQIENSAIYQDDEVLSYVIVLHDLSTLNL